MSSQTVAPALPKFDNTVSRIAKRPIFFPMLWHSWVASTLHRGKQPVSFIASSFDPFSIQCYDVVRNIAFVSGTYSNLVEFSLWGASSVQAYYYYDVCYALPIMRLLKFD